MDHPTADEVADLVLGDVGTRIDGKTAGRGNRGRGIDRLQGCMRVWRAHEHRIGLAWPIDVVGVLALAGDEALIFLAPNRSADAGGGHGFPPRVSCWTSVLILTRRPELGETRALLARSCFANLTTQPKSLSCAASLRSLAHATHGGGARFYRSHDIVVAGAAAQVALKSLADGVLVEIGALPLRQVHGSHDHAWCAEAALQPVVLAERFLHRVESAVLGEPLDGRHLRAIAAEG